MEGLRQISQKIFNSNQTFNNTAHRQALETLLITKSSDRGPNVNRGYLVETELCAWSKESHLNNKATLRLVCLNAERNTSLSISTDTFSHLMINFRVDPSVLYLICHTKDGFHFFPGNAETEGSLLPTWFVGSSRFAVLWTFDPKGCLTSGIFIERQRNSFRGLIGVLERFTDNIHTSYVMCFAIPLFLVHFYDARVESALNEMRQIEKAVGFGPRRGYGQWQRDTNTSGEENNKATFTIDEILALSQKVHEVAGKIKNSDRLRRSSTRMLEAILAANDTASAVIAGTDGSNEDTYKHALRDLSNAVPVLQRQMDANADYLAYMQYRAENLSQVIIALLTHEDAGASIDLACASKKDTSSMKTIAIMTMVFLPATFFAALFSLPLLEWDQPKVIHDRFWVYWAFTVPCTFAVFVIWLVTAAGGWSILRDSNSQQVKR